MIYRRFFLLSTLIFTSLSCGLLKSFSKNKSDEKKTSSPIRLEKESAAIYQNLNLPLDNKVEDYIRRFAGTAVREMSIYGIPASIKLAQGILESGAGQSPLARKSNNHFGIKCHTNWKGKSVNHDDDELQECFRKYDDPKKSYRDHSKFLTTRGRYSSLFKLKADDYKSWAIGLKLAGYATDSNYPEKIIQIIETYKLYQFDKMTFSENKVSKETPLKGVITPPVENVSEENAFLGKQKKVEDRIYEQINERLQKSDSLSKIVKNKIEEEQQKEKKALKEERNKFILHKVKQKETLYSISRKYKVPIDSIIKLNKIKDNTIFFDQELIIKKKDVIQEK